MTTYHQLATTALGRVYNQSRLQSQLARIGHRPKLDEQIVGQSYNSRGINAGKALSSVWIAIAIGKSLLSRQAPDARYDAFPDSFSERAR